MHKNNPHLGSTFDSFLEEEGILEEVKAAAIKRVIVYQIKDLLKKQNLTQADLAKKMNTSKSVINRLLNTKNPSVTLQTLLKATHALGKNLTFSID